MVVLASPHECGGRMAEPVSGERDWFVVRSWDEVYARTGLSPRVLPGVRTTTHHPVETLAPATSSVFRQQAGASAIAPHPYRVHRTHLPVIGYAAPANPTLPELDGDGILRPHQKTGVAFIRERRGILLADEMRVGKTAQVVYSHERDSGLLVMVGPVAARAAWHEWVVRRFGACPDAVPVGKKRGCHICARVRAVPQDGPPTFLDLSGRTPRLDQLARGARAVFMTYAAVPTWSEAFASFGTIGTFVCDEAHLAGVQHRRNVTIVGIRRLNVMSHRTVFATGSPLWNMPSGLWPIVDTVCPTSFGGFWEFARRYCDAKPGAHGWTTNGTSHEGELEARLSAIMLRRTWNEIQADLPPINRTLEYIELSDDVHASVYEAAAEIRRTLGAGRAQTAVGNLERLRALYAKTKIARAVQLAQETLGNGHNLIVWTQHRNVAASMVTKLRAGGAAVFGPVNGQMAPSARERLLEEARAYAGAHVLVATMGSLATAVSLNWASHEIFAELDWTPAVIQQAEMRPYDGTRPISSIMLVADCDTDRAQIDALLPKFEANTTLGLRAGVGDVSDVLSNVFGVEVGKTLDDIAALILREETA